MSVTALWWVVGLTAVACFAVKFVGYLIPQHWLAHPRLQRINALIPIALLSALVVAQSVVSHTRVVIDHRLVGVAVAIVALVARLPFLAVVLSAAVASALVVHLAG
jgi:uncharacterized membrane protein